MKKSGQCPKCEGRNIHVSAVSIMLRNTIALNSIPITSSVVLGSSPAQVHHYICTDCGYVEQYVASKTKLREIVAKLPRVEPEK